MKPTTRAEEEVVELSAKLSPPTAADWNYFLGAGSRHFALYSGKRAKCTDCGHEWYQRGLNKQVRCPHCGRLLTIENTRARKKSEIVYTIILQAVNGWQVIRYFRLKWSCPVKGGRVMSVDEVVQQWVSSEGKLYIIARKKSMGMFIDSFNLGEPMSLKRNVDDAAYHLPYWGVIVKGVIPKLRRNGFKHSLYCMRTYDLFRLLLTNPFAETLYKTGYGYLLRQLDYDGSLHDGEVVAAAKIVLRNRYMVPSNDWGLWVDMVKNLIQLGKDVHNSLYVCPKDLKKAHDDAVAKVRRKREQERAREEDERIRKDKRLANSYVRRMKKFFGLIITDGKIEICVLKNVGEFEAEGKAMHHCVFENRYFAKENSLIMSAKVNGKRQETVEVNLKRFEVAQSRGVNNSNSKYHDEIVSLVNANMGKIRKIQSRKRAKVTIS